MNKVAEKWVKALRSGKFKQAQGALAKVSKTGKVSGHCCLGVLCELAVKAKVVKRVINKKNAEVRYGGDYALLPYKVRKWAKLRLANGGYGQADSLAAANDGGMSFKRIARLIEEKAETLFE